VAALGLGLAALGRPGYLTVAHDTDLAGDRSVEAMERRCHEVCDAAWHGGIRWFDAARSYGLAEQFLADWLSGRAIPPADVTVSSKWGYTYTAGWAVDADPPEVKDHRLAALDRQWPESQALLGRWLRLYQVHSATEESGILDDPAVHRALAGLGVPVGVTLSGPRQAQALRRAVGAEVDGSPLFSAVQATWNLLEPSVGPALAEAKDAGWTVIIKEALANGRLVSPNTSLGAQPDAVAIAAALQQPWADVVLSGAVTAAQVESNQDARSMGPIDVGRFAHLVVEPETYWSQRSAMPWT
jgi:aryl-alcohol dehydrogenase-like predicted oxidoreductase